MIVQINGPRAFPRGDYDELVKLQWRNLKAVFSTGPISTKLGTKYLWVKAIQIYSNEGPRPSQSGDNWEIININWQLLKNFFHRTTWPILTQSILGCRGFKFAQMKGPFFFQGEIITKLWKYIDEIKNSSSPEPLGQFQSNLTQIILG